MKLCYGITPPPYLGARILYLIIILLMESVNVAESVELHEDEDRTSRPFEASTTKAKSICFTLNNYTDDEVEKMKTFSKLCRYLIFGYEVSKTGTPHLQGYAQLIKQTALNTLRRMFRWHIEKTMGTPEQASAYCKKEGHFEEFGELSTCAKGTEKSVTQWNMIVSRARVGDLQWISENYPAQYLNHYSTICKLRTDHAIRPIDNEDGTTGYWIYGMSGVGKSRSVREELVNRGESYYCKNNNKWWDSYLGEPNVIIDDVDKGSQCLGHLFKIWADRYAFLAETKGSAIYVRPKRIIVTSQYTPEEIWGEDPAMVEAIRRRFKFMHLIGYDPVKRLLG